MKKTNTTTTETTIAENILTYSANPFCEFDKKTNLQQEHISIVTSIKQDAIIMIGFYIHCHY